MNRKLYRQIINNPEGLQALQNTDILPEKYVRYSDALRVFERQEFKTFLNEDSFEKFRQKVDLERIFENELYLERVSRDLPLGEAEAQRQKARNLLNDALYQGFIKSVIFEFDGDKSLKIEPTDLSRNFWKSKRAFNIDPLSLYFIKRERLFSSEGLIALDRKTLEKWGAAFPNPPRKSGRPKGKAYDDTKQVEYMRKLIMETGCTQYHASKEAAGEFGHKTSFVSEVSRLNKSYKETYPSQKN